MTDRVEDLAMRAAFGSWFGLERASTRVLVALYRNRAAITSQELALRAGVTEGALVRHHMPLLRQALNTEGIDYEAPAGYRLTDDGEAECRAVLWQIGEELRRAG